MLWRYVVRFVLACTALLAGTAWTGIARSGDDPPNVAVLVADLERLLNDVATGGEIAAGAAQLVPQLIELVDEGYPGESSLAMRALAAIGPEAAPAVGVLCERLDDPVHSYRAYAVDALVAIGEPAVEPLRMLLTSPSGRIRAAAVVALHRLGSLTLDELTSRTADADPRVRAAVADSLAEAGAGGVPTLAHLLNDPESAVAAKAAASLKFNRGAPDIAILALIDALPREQIGWAAVDALAAYGIEAQRAVPAIIAHCPLGVTADWVASEITLQHIGPPHVDDIPAIAESLFCDNEEARILAANTLAVLRRDGAAAADQLEAAITGTLDRYLEKKVAWEQNRDDSRLQPGRWKHAADCMLSALWQVTGDADRFLAAVDRATAQAEVEFSWSDVMRWQYFDPEQYLMIEPLLRSSDHNVQISALAGVREIGPDAASLKEVLLELAGSEDAELAEQATLTLQAITPLVSEESPPELPVLLAHVRSGALPLDEFASAIESLGHSSEDADRILRYGIEHEGVWTAEACARALCVSSTESEANVLMLLDLARKGEFADLDLIECLRGTQAAPGDVIPYLIGQLSNEDYWTRRAAAFALGDYGPDAQQGVESLRRQLDDEGIELRLAAARSILEIMGEETEFVSELDAAFGSRHEWDRYEAIQVIGELGPAGAPFLPYIVRELNNPDFQHAQILIDALLAIGTNEAMAALQQTAESHDWILRSTATEAIRVLEETQEVRDE